MIPFALLTLLAGIVFGASRQTLLARRRHLRESATTPIAAAVPGSAAVEGVVWPTGEPFTTSAGAPAVYRQIGLEKFVWNRHYAGWENVSARTEEAPFYVADQTGVVSVVTIAAKLDLSEVTRGWHTLSETERRSLRAWLGLPSDVPGTSLLARAFARRYRVRERALLVGETAYVEGTYRSQGVTSVQLGQCIAAHHGSFSAGPYVADRTKAELIAQLGRHAGRLAAIALGLMLAALIVLLWRTLG